MQKTHWPLFWCLKPAAQALLMQYQWDNHGTKLSIPPPPDTSPAEWAIVLSESREEVDRLMRQRPHYKGAGWRG